MILSFYHATAFIAITWRLAIARIKDDEKLARESSVVMRTDDNSIAIIFACISQFAPFSRFCAPITIQMMPSNHKKWHRVPPNHRHSAAALSPSRLSSTAATIDSLPDKTVNETSQKLRRTSSHPLFSSSALPSATNSSFNDATTADVVLRLFIDPSAPVVDSASGSPTIADQPDIQIYLHSHVLRRAKYFSALLSDRWKNNVHNDSETKEESSECENLNELTSLKLAVSPSSGAIDTHMAVLQLLYTDDFATVINSAGTALDILPVALELLFEDCVTSCVKFLEAVPWSEAEEKRVMNIVPFLREEESEELLARVLPVKDECCEEMLDGLIAAAIHSYPNMAFVKAFVAKLLRDVPSRESARSALERAFETSLKIVKGSLEEYSSPDFRGDHNETEAIQRLNLHTANTNGRHLLWLVERMIELKVADGAVKEWSEQATFTADLQRAFRDDAWRNIVPGLPAVMLRCTCKLANGVAAGTILVTRQVRMKLVKYWLPVLIVCKENLSPMLPSQKSLYLEVEETFLKIISTLPMPESQELLQKCLSLSSRNVEDCPHLVSAFNTWFRRAGRSPPHADSLS